MNEDYEWFVKEYNLDMKFTDFEETEIYEYEDVIVPVRLIMEDDYPDALDYIIEADKRLIKGYESLKDDSPLKKLLSQIYHLAKKNVEAHKLDKVA